MNELRDRAMTGPRIAKPVRRRAARAAVVPAIMASALALSAPIANASGESVDQMTETALTAQAHPERGHALFDRHCARCHGAGARGDVPDRAPVLAGQRFAYLVRQLASLSGDQRDSVDMHRELSAAAKLRDPHTWADVAAYLNAAPVPVHAQTGDGRQLGLGEATFHVECASCHHDDARGDDDGLVPSLRNQHYSYLLSQIRRLSELHRRNVDENVARLLHSLDSEESRAVADYLSRLRGPLEDPQPRRDSRLQ